MTHDFARSCLGKHRYGAESDAHAVAANAYRKRRTWLRVYICESCGGYHLTKTNALPPQPGRWRPPAKSQRQLARERHDHRRRK